MAKLAVISSSAILSFCGCTTVGDIPKEDSQLGEEGTMRIEVAGSGQERTVLEQCVRLKALLVGQGKLGSSWNKSNARFAALLRGVIFLLV